MLAYKNPENIQESEALTALVFYEGYEFPPALQGTLFFADIDRHFMATGDVSTGTMERFAEQTAYLVDMAYHE